MAAEHASTCDRPPGDIARVAVIYGGWSHEANYNAAPWIVETINGMGLEAVAIDYRSPEFQAALHDTSFDVFFPQTLGAYGEDGTLQGLLDFHDVKYVGSGIAASSLCANKAMCSEFVRGLGARSDGSRSPGFWAPCGVLISSESRRAYPDLVRIMGVPFIMKPMASGASFGVTVIDSQAAWNDALARLLPEFNYVIAENFVSGTEYTVGLLELDGTLSAFGPKRVACNVTHAFQSQADKLEIASQNVPVDEPLSSWIKNVALEIAAAMGICGYARLDVIVDDSGCIHVLDINTLPGIVPGLSTLPAMCADHGIPYPEMIGHLLASALRPKPMQMPKLVNPPPLPEKLAALLESTNLGTQP